MAKMRIMSVRPVGFQYSGIGWLCNGTGCLMVIFYGIIKKRIFAKSYEMCYFMQKNTDEKKQ